MNPETRFRKTALRSAVLLALSITGAAVTVNNARADQQACADNPVSTDSGNFTMLTSAGYTMGPGGGTNDASMTWDGTVFTNNSDYTGPEGVSNVTMSSTAPFFGPTWTAHDIQVFAPGSYSFDTTLQTAGAPNGSNPESGIMNVTVGAGQIGIHMLFDWNGNNNIDVFVVAAKDGVFGAGIGRNTQNFTTVSAAVANYCDGQDTASAPGAPIKNCLFDGKPLGTAGKPDGASNWMLVSVDGNSDGVMGIPMQAGGPFQFFNANFNFNFTAAPTYTAGTLCNPTDDTEPDPFDFPDETGATINTEYTSDPITVTGLNDLDGGGVVAPISVAGGTYSINGGAYTSVAGTVQNNDIVTVRQTSAANEDGTRTDTLLNIGGVPGTYSVTVVDTKADVPIFTTQTGVTLGSSVESNTVTITGMDAGSPTNISISGGQYIKNGGTPTSVDGTVVAGDTISIVQTAAASGATTTIATLTLGSALNGTQVTSTFTVTTAGGVNSTGNNFTMLDKSGSNDPGGTNDVVLFWDQQYNAGTNDAVTTATAHMRLTSVTPFFQNRWTAHHIRVFGPGTYVINVDCTVADLETASGCQPNADPSKNYTFTVGADQIGAHMLFDWNNSTNIDVVNIWEQNMVFAPSPLHTGFVGFNSPTTVWSLMSSDSPASCPGALDEIGNPINCGVNGINGIPMIDGPFKGFSANFNVNFVGSLAPSDYTPTVNVGDPSASTGCSISQKPVSLLERSDWWLVAGFLAWLGAVRKRFKRQA